MECLRCRVPQHLPHSAVTKILPRGRGTGEDICPMCTGRGRVKEAMCPNCAGKGKIIKGVGGG